MDTNIKQSMDHAWRYFELHAQQRMTVFNFYLAISGLTAAGIGVSLQYGSEFSIVTFMLGNFLSLISFIFWKLDQRVSELIKRSERALSELEKVSSIKYAILFLEEGTDPKSMSYGLLSTWTYGRCFRVSFVTVALSGLVFAMLPFLLDISAK